jgi:VIT1/CCC1 family predicted Fe2+/Mn2+ transporter
LRSAATIALSYIAGGLIPLAPYLLTPQSQLALRYSVAATVLALAVFGFVKGRFTGVSPWKSAFRTTLIGGVAAAAAFGIAKIFTT